jgi:hypothetical protein
MPRGATVMPHGARSIVSLTTEETMKAQPDQDLTEEPMLPDYEIGADLEAWIPQDFDRFDEFGASRMPDRAE